MPDDIQNKEERGFFIKVREDFYLGPCDKLSEARNTARAYGPDIPIYHGILVRISEDIFDDSKLFLIPKTEQE